MKLYIAGPMTGYPGHNLSAFAQAADQLRDHGYDAVNPGQRGVIEGWSWADYLREDLRLLLDCTGVALLNGWEGSRGALVEVHVAKHLSMPVEPIAVWLHNGARRNG